MESSHPISTYCCSGCNVSERILLTTPAFVILDCLVFILQGLPQL